jgi:hypothetical protein
MYKTFEEWYENECNNTISESPDLDEEVVIERSKFLDENGVDIRTKKSKDKTIDERIKTSRSLKIKYNKWNQVDFTEDTSQEKISIDKNYTQQSYSYDDIEFENKFHEIIKNSKYKAILLNEDCERVVINYQVINDILIYTFGKMKNEYSLSRIFVMVCEYCGINIQPMWKRLSSYMQKQILEELCEYSFLPNLELNNNDNNKLF